MLAEDHIEGPLNVSGHLMDLGVTSEKDDTGEFRLLSNFSDSDDIISVKNDLEEKTVKVTDSPLRPEDQIVLMDFFRVAGDDDERAGSYILCAIDETILRYRKISSENGKPQGGSKLGLVINDLVIGSIDSEYCCDKVNLVYSSIISKKKSRIYFERFEME